MLPLTPLRIALLLLASTLLAAPLCAQQSALYRLYTQPDPNASGGITGVAAVSSDVPKGVFALPRGDPSKVYSARIEPDRSFHFNGLPVGRYDLVILYEDGFYEGLQLSREDNLTARDHDLIKAHIERTGPFFETKAYHRMAGPTATGSQAQLIYQEMHVREEGEIRSIKLGVMVKVGEVGWQMQRSREIVRSHKPAPGYTIHDMRTERDLPDKPLRGSGILPHHHRPEFGGFRVVDSVRDIGTLR